MNQYEKVIQVLENANKGRLDYRNRLWLYENIGELNIKVSEPKDDLIIIDEQKIGEIWGELGRILIQRGEEVTLRTAFHPGAEALLVRKNHLRGYYVYLYTPKKSKGE